MRRRSPVPALRRVATATALSLVAGLSLAACGGDDDGGTTAAATSSGAATTATTAAKAAFPVEIAHALGTTTIPEEPKRVVVVGLSDQDALLALGVKPVGAMDWFGEDTYGKWPWEEAAWGGEPAALVSTKSYEINFEAVAAQRPDLILGLYSKLSRSDYDKLSKIAPTVAQAKGTAYTTPWRDMARVAAKAVGRTDQAEKLIKEIDDRMAAFRESHPKLQGQTALVVDAGNGPKSYYPFASKDPRGQLIAELGFKGSPAIDKLAGKDGFGTEVARERTDLLDVDRLFLLIDAAPQKRVEADKLFQRLDVVKSGNVTNLPYYKGTQLGAALAFSTLLSIPYALDELEKELPAG
ncbi:Putative ABC transporter substrate-binding lipoprotein YhfQ [Paraconexibacter sp. AEG42_29]|uniref:ABC transporter substrate-binding lipoprotein YhfQ n=1 Tax=Paraconexibacter sp. AEG42_29 TaxID=2997339 RepID=A0AAU7AU93_9ACTN